MSQDSLLDFATNHITERKEFKAKAFGNGFNIMDELVDVQKELMRIVAIDPDLKHNQTRWHNFKSKEIMLKTQVADLSRKGNLQMMGRLKREPKQQLGSDHYDALQRSPLDIYMMSGQYSNMSMEESAKHTDEVRIAAMLQPFAPMTDTIKSLVEVAARMPVNRTFERSTPLSIKLGSFDEYQLKYIRFITQGCQKHFLGVYNLDDAVALDFANEEDLNQFVFAMPMSEEDFAKRRLREL